MITSAVANHLLAREGWARERLAQHAGQTFAIAVGPFRAELAIDANGMLFAPRTDAVAPDVTLRFLKAWIEGLYLFKAKPDYAFVVLKKYVATQDQEVLNTIYNLYKERLAYKPTPTANVAKSMLYLLSRSSPQVGGVSPEGFIEPRYVNELESSGFFEEMTRHYSK